MLIDTHGHVNLEAFEEDRDQVIERIEQAEMKVVMPATDFASSRLSVELAQQHGSLLAAIGLHPSEVEAEEFATIDYQELINTGLVTAIGECGLDYFRLPDDPTERQRIKDLQQDVFELQIILAQSNNLPLILHGREAKVKGQDDSVYDRMLRLLAERQVDRAVFHCFGGTLEQAKEITSHGYHLGITGIITFDKTGLLEQIVREVPFESILLETDSPFLTPEPYRGQRNEPIYVIEVAKKVAEIKGLSVEEVIEQTGRNASELFDFVRA